MCHRTSGRKGIAEKHMENKPNQTEKQNAENDLLRQLMAEVGMTPPASAEPAPAVQPSPVVSAAPAPVSVPVPAAPVPAPAPAPAAVKKEDEEEDEDDDQLAEKPKPGFGCLTTFGYCLLVLGLSVLLSAVAILAANDMFALVKNDRAIEVTIEEDQTLDEIADLMEDRGVIRYSSLFWLFGRMTAMDDQLLPGTYTLNSNMDYRTILSKIKYKPSTKEVVTITIPEGMVQDDIFALLEANGVCDAYLLKAYAKYYDFSYSFLKDLPYEEKRLEGFLFPDTYDFYVNDSPVRVLKRFLANFNRKWTVDMKARAENINMPIRDVMIIASMIEREAKYDDERPVISSVIHNRLQSDSFPYLQIDATVQYALPEWKEALSDEDLKVDSPYNTYLYEGLPVGPISNPGLAAIRAALYPEESGYYYYVARKNGWHYFAKTAAEHQENINKVKTESVDETSDPDQNTILG